MNKELLNTPIVKESIIRYLYLGLSYNEILDKLMDIHLIIITEDELKCFIKNHLDKFLK